MVEAGILNAEDIEQEATLYAFLLPVWNAWRILTRIGRDGNGVMALDAVRSYLVSAGVPDRLIHRRSLLVLAVEEERRIADSELAEADRESKQNLDAVNAKPGGTLG